MYMVYREVQLYKITFDEPIQPDTDVRFGVRLTYTHVLTPLPAKIPQVARQFVVYNDNIYMYSPYFTDEIKTTLQ